MKRFVEEEKNGNSAEEAEQEYSKALQEVYKAASTYCDDTEILLIFALLLHITKHSQTSEIFDNNLNQTIKVFKIFPYDKVRKSFKNTSL